MSSNNDIFEIYNSQYDAHKASELSLREYLRGCREDPMIDRCDDRHNQQGGSNAAKQAVVGVEDVDPLNALRVFN